VAPDTSSWATKTVDDATRSYYMVANPKPQQIDLGDYKYGFRDEEDYVFKSKKGLTRQVVEEISSMKGEPDWMR
jgi:hypothetical protein